MKTARLKTERCRLVMTQGLFIGRYFFDPDKQPLYSSIGKDRREEFVAAYDVGTKGSAYPDRG